MNGRLTRRRMDIERLVNWALADHGLGWAGKERERLDASDYGTVIDDERIGGHPTISLLTDDDALVVKAAIDGLPGEAAALVIQYGRLGLRPEGADEAIGEPQQMRNRRGQLMWEYEVPGNRRSRRRPLIDHLAFSAHREGVLFARAQWTLWREALIALIAPLNNRLEGHYATGPEAPERPWELPRPVYHGIDPVEVERTVAPVLPDRVRRAMAGKTVDDLRVAASAPVLTRPLNWSVPEG